MNKSFIAIAAQGEDALRTISKLANEALNNKWPVQAVLQQVVLIKMTAAEALGEK